jgi:hypothetical protein
MTERTKLIAQVAATLQSGTGSAMTTKHAVSEAEDIIAEAEDREHRKIQKPVYDYLLPRIKDLKEALKLAHHEAMELSKLPKFAVVECLRTSDQVAIAEGLLEEEG